MGSTTLKEKPPPVQTWEIETWRNKARCKAVRNRDKMGNTQTQAEIIPNIAEAKAVNVTTLNATSTRTKPGRKKQPNARQAEEDENH